MRFVFKTRYEQDFRLARHEGHLFWYGLLVLLLLAAPWALSEYALAQLTFVLIYSVVGLGLMLLAGFTGLFSIGHAAFLGVGAYTQAVLSNAGWPFPLSLAAAALLSSAVGVVVGLPALRLHGVYLALTTFAVALAVPQLAKNYSSFTGGTEGLALPTHTGMWLYYVGWGVAGVMFVLAWLLLPAAFVIMLVVLLVKPSGLFGHARVRKV